MQNHLSRDASIKITVKVIIPFAFKAAALLAAGIVDFLI
ncbi:hypothetical protein RINTU1_16740 [Candidatus Regiella insecticola]|uniref:Uncharacterized protein n=1 Tax=Candidatus Regiella insecticola TaxID=138073 RepID=A0A6L2ZPM5_9ENTR|nr:hypothetical protein RINTU1_16740 [Candidatus Regiella insecticola]